MPIYDHLTSFAGKPIKEVEWGKTLADLAGGDVGAMAWRIAVPYEDEKKWPERFRALTEDPSVSKISSLVIGAWSSELYEDDSSLVVKSLVDAKERFPSLRDLFVGEMVCEESEISWIKQSSMEPLWKAFPNLKNFTVRGGDGLRLGTLQHASLESLVIEAGGLSAEAVRDVAAARLPNLKWLELWLGQDDYGATWSMEDLKPILQGDLFPNLRTLGLRNSEKADELAGALAHAPILGRLETLDLSLGTLSDEGASALLAAPDLSRLRKLDIHYHYCSEDLTAQLRTMGPEVDDSDRQEGDEDDGTVYRYSSVGE